LPLARAWKIADKVYDFTQVREKKLGPPTYIYKSNFLNLLQQADLTINWLNSFRVMDKTRQHLLTPAAKEAIVEEARQDLLALGAREVIIALGSLLQASRHLSEQFAESVGLRNVGAEWIIPIAAKDETFCLNNPPIAIHPGCTEESRRWPAASFAAIINRLLRLHQTVLLLAGPADTEALREVRGYLSSPPKPGMLTILRNAPFLEIAHRLKQCRCFLGNDSGITHLAALLGVPTIALFLPEFVIPMHPIGPSVVVIAEERLKRLSVERVFTSILHVDTT
jgi:ADP-heptose:LPS heptosyltransferase